MTTNRGFAEMRRTITAHTAIWTTILRWLLSVM